MRRLAILAILLAAYTSSAMAEETSRICTETDLAGAYNIVSLKETPPGDEAAWYKDYKSQYLVFGSDHNYSFVASKHPITKSDDLKKAIQLSATDGMHVFDRKYTLDATGVLDLYIDGVVDYSYRCMVVQKSVNVLIRPGDLIFTGYSKHKTLLEKVFRRTP